MKKSFILSILCIMFNLSLFFAESSTKHLLYSDSSNVVVEKQISIAEDPIPFDYFDFLDLFALYFGREEYLV